jgi:invasion protein IalB
MMTMTSNAANMPKTSCSTLKKGQTVNITATKNAAGQLIAIKIKPVFY